MQDSIKKSQRHRQTGTSDSRQTAAMDSRALYVDFTTTSPCEDSPSPVRTNSHTDTKAFDLFYSIAAGRNTASFVACVFFCI